MTIESENERFSESEASEELINEMFADSKKSNCFIILNDDDDNYIQALAFKSKKHGLNYIEYRENEQNYGCLCNGNAHEKIREAFIKYLKRDHSWRDMFEWTPIDEDDAEEDTAEDVDWDEELYRLELGEEEELILTRRKIKGTVRATVTKSDGSKVTSMRTIDTLLNLVTSTEIVTKGVPDSIGEAFVVALIAAGICFWQDFTPWKWYTSGLAALLFICLFYKQYSFRIAIAGSEMEIPCTTSNKEDVVGFVAAVHEAKEAYESRND